MKSLPVVLSIAGFDPSSGAGITADLAVFAAHGCFGVSCVTALTTQSTLGVRAVHAVEAGQLADSLRYLTEDLPPAGVKIGMLATAEIVDAVAGFLEGIGQTVPVVMDPVLRSSSGRSLLDDTGVRQMQKRLLPLVAVVTPNVDEVRVLTGLPAAGGEDLEQAARVLQARYPELAVIVTGGEMEVPTDVLVDREGAVTSFPGERVESRATHGTGCAFSSAVLAGLVQGRRLPQAVGEAKEYVAEAIRRAPGLGSGFGPMDLYWPMRARS